MVLVYNINPYYFITDQKPVIMERDNSELKAMRKKLVTYEKMIDQLSEIKNGKNAVEHLFMQYK
ncbi:MAG: hypothetical protein ICV51_09155 [Flavisolibacter sp.]|nr:hypothetical protein [Flavisolibacter sp.]MBD0352199.1 hypothetical protein [Flavisolibacter sp.]MBD0375781.1 hypothetical protein [Flavisolibacter sp.]